MSAADAASPPNSPRFSLGDLEQFFSAALDLLCIATTDGRFVRLNREWERTLGYRLEDLEGTAFLSYVHPDDLDATLEAVATLSNQEEVLNFTNRYRCADGSYRWIEWRSVPVGDLIYAAARDVTMRKQNELALQESEARYRITIAQMATMQATLAESEILLSGVLNSSLDGIMAFRAIRDAHGTITDFAWLICNPSASSMVGRPASTLIGKQLLVEMPGNRAEGLFDAYVRVVETGEPFRREFHYEHEGVSAWFENSAVQLGDGFAVTFRDITAIKQAAEALRETNQLLESTVADLRQRHAEMVILSELSDFLQACVTVHEAAQAVATHMQDLFPGCAGSILIFNPATDEFECQEHWGEQVISATHVRAQACWSLRRGRTHRADAARAGLRCQHIVAASDNLVTLCVPMVAQGETLGLIVLGSTNATQLAEVQQQLARTVAEHVALAIANLHLRETLQQQSIRDELTGLQNRRYLDEALAQELVRAQRQNDPVSVILIDIDHFKAFNDTYGHAVGDHVLQTVGVLLRSLVRGGDLACRYGGEELVLVLPTATHQVALDRAEHVRQAISQLRLVYQEQQLDQITASLGVATYPTHGNSATVLLHAADQALYRAKNAGRNRVVAAQVE